MPEGQTSIGAPVELRDIDRELKKLWASNAGAKTRASHINLAVYSEETDSLERNTELVDAITQNHACRAIVIAAQRDAAADNVQAWINAHCHVRAGTNQICSEQISLLLHGTKLLPSVLFSHLDSDLPLYLWWQSPFRGPIDPQVWTWVDRLIYDSAEWENFDEQLRLVEKARAEAAERQMVLCDLNWTRLLHFRLAFAQFFDHPASHHRFDKMDRAMLLCGKGERAAALLYVGWLAAQLSWEVLEADGAVTLRKTDGQPLVVELKEEGPDVLNAFTVHAGEVEFRVRRAACGDLLEVSRGDLGEEHAPQMLPAGKNDPASLVSEELLRGGAHRVYLRAVEKVRRFL